MLLDQDDDFNIFSLTNAEQRNKNSQTEPRPKKKGSKRPRSNRKQRKAESGPGDNMRIVNSECPDDNYNDFMSGHNRDNSENDYKQLRFAEKLLILTEQNRKLKS